MVDAMTTAAFNDQAARAKFVLDGQFVVAVAAYPFIMVITLAARQSWMSLITPRTVAAGTPPGGTPMGPDLWVTNDPLTLATTCFAFAAVFVTHAILLGHLTTRRLPGATEMGMRYSAASTLSLLLITVTYFLYYIPSSRYGPKSAEWIIFAVATTLLAMYSLFNILKPLKQRKVVKFGQAP